MYTYLADDGVDETAGGEEREESDKLVRVLLELEVHGRRVEDGADEVALGGHVAGADDHGQGALAGVGAGLDDLGAAVEGVARVLVGVVDILAV